MERSGNFYKAIRLGYILISILIGCMAYNSLYEWRIFHSKMQFGVELALLRTPPPLLGGREEQN